MPETARANEAPPLRHRLKRWGPLAAVFAILALTALVDTRLKTSDRYGYAPADTDWLAASDDFGQFWAGIEQSDTMAILMETGPHPLAGLSATFRRAVGIRPTPGRWNVWLGPRLVAWQRGDERGFCVRPGVLVRAAHLLHLSTRTTIQDTRVYRHRELFYTWRDGFVVAATSPADLATAAEVTTARIGRAGHPRELRFTAHIPEEVRLHFQGADGLPVSGSLRLALSGGRSRLVTPAAWPVPPVCLLAAGDGRNLAALLRAAGRKAASLPAMERPARFANALVRHWGTPSFEALASIVPGEQCIGIADFDLSVFPPLPIVAWLMRPEHSPEGLHPWAALLPPDLAVPFEWEHRPGLIVPWFSEKASLHLGQTEALWVATTQEPLMADFATAVTPSLPVEADAMFVLDWGKAAHAAQALLLQLEELELLRPVDRPFPGSGHAQIAGRLQHLGRVEITGLIVENRLEFAGHLAVQEDQP